MLDPQEGGSARFPRFLHRRLNFRCFVVKRCFGLQSNHLRSMRGYIYWRCWGVARSIVKKIMNRISMPARIAFRMGSTCEVSAFFRTKTPNWTGRVRAIGVVAPRESVLIAGARMHFLWGLLQPACRSAKRSNRFDA